MEGNPFIVKEGNPFIVKGGNQFNLGISLLAFIINGNSLLTFIKEINQFIIKKDIP